MVNEKGTENRQDRETGQESGTSLTPSLVPEHDSILLDRFEEDLAQSDRGNLDRNSI